MADRSIELLNELLGLFNQESQTYLELVGDASHNDRGWVLGGANLSGTVDLTGKYKLKLDVDSGGPWTVDFSSHGSFPTLTITEIVSHINTTVGLTVAYERSRGSQKFLLILSPTTDGTGTVELLEPTSNDALATLMRLKQTSGYHYSYPDSTKKRVNDFDMGAIANVLEYSRMLGKNAPSRRSLWIRSAITTSAPASTSRRLL